MTGEIVARAVDVVCCILVVRPWGWSVDDHLMLIHVLSLGSRGNTPDKKLANPVVVRRDFCSGVFKYLVLSRDTSVVLSLPLAALVLPAS